MSNEVLRMQHREHPESVQKFVTPLSPMLHFLCVPCHRRFSFPGDLPTATKFPLPSVLSLPSNYPVNYGNSRYLGELVVPVFIEFFHAFFCVDNLVNGPDWGTFRSISPGFLKLRCNWGLISPIHCHRNTVGIPFS